MNLSGVKWRETQLKIVKLEWLQLSFRLKVRTDPSIAIYFGVFNRGTFIPNLSRIFGSEFAIAYVPANKVRAPITLIVP